MVVKHHPQRRYQRMVILQRLAHAHHHDVGDDALANPQLEPLAQMMLGVPKLADDLAGRQVAAETLVARRAKAATHRTTRLRGHAQRAAVGFRDEHRLYRIATANIEQPLDRAVGRGLLAEQGQRPNHGHTRQLVTQGLGEVRHASEIALALLVDPAKQLNGAKTLLAELATPGSERIKVEIEQIDRCHELLAGLALRKAEAQRV